MTKFKAGDFVKLVNTYGLYPDQNYGEDVRLELGETYPVTEIDGDLICLMKSDGTTESCFPYRVALVTGGQTAESLKETILSIRQEREQTLSKLKDLDAQEAEAISQLNTLGFSLFEEGKVKSSPSKTVLYAEDIEEDMTDPKNWKVGDIFVCLKWYAPGDSETYRAGDMCEMVGLEDGKWPELKSPRGYVTGIAPTDCFMFHSRPVK